MFNSVMRIAFRLITLFVLCLICQRALGQHYLEVRGASSRYRYFDWNYTFANSAVLDVFYVGVPGSNEFNFGGGYLLKSRRSLLITPLAYAVIGKEGGQRGLKLAVLVSFDNEKWRLNSFLGHYVRFAGEVGSYQVLDSLDASRVIHRRWEIGISNGFYHAERKWNPLIGPLLKLNDRLGYWSVSYRFGPQNEFRACRVFLFKKGN